MDKFDARQATLDLVTAFVNNNSLKSQELPALLSEVYGAIAGFGGKAVEIILSDKASTAPQEVSTIASALEPVIESENANFKAAVTIEELLRDRNFIVSMITGEKMKTLARHLRRHGLDEQQYRERYNLPKDYPMVAPAYSELRRSVAKKMSLGRVGRTNLSVAKQSASTDAVKSAPAKGTEVKAKAKPEKVEKSKSVESGKPSIKMKTDKAVSKAANAKAPVSSLPKVPKKGRGAKVVAEAAMPKIVPLEETKITSPAQVAPAKRPGRPTGKGKAVTATPVAAPPTASKVVANASESVTIAPATTKPATTKKADSSAAVDTKADRRKLKPVFNG